MASLDITNTHVAGTTAKAADVNQNFTDVESFVNNSVVHVDGTKPLTGQLTLFSSSPTNALHAASKGYADNQDKYRYKYVGIGNNAMTRGTAPVVGTDEVIMLGGMVTATTSGLGVISIPFNQPYNKVISVTVSINSEPAGALRPASQQAVRVATVSDTNFEAQVIDLVNNVALAGSPVAVSFIALVSGPYA